MSPKKGSKKDVVQKIIQARKTFSLRHIIESQQFDRSVLETIFETAALLKSDFHSGRGIYAQTLAGKIMASLFYEPSTRTRFSFESAMTRLGGRVITTENAKEFSSAAKGETIEDSTRVINSYVDLIVMRHYEAGSAKKAADVSRVPVINAGDGAGQHPTQALLDLYTILENLETIDGVKVAMVGDLKYGRTTRSLAYLLSKFEKVKIYFVSPSVCRMEDDIKNHLNEHGIDWEEEDSLEKVLPLVDCVYMTRVQKERFPNPKDYQEAAGKYILSLDKVQTMKKDAIIMHPLPRVNEIPPEVDDDSRARYFEQAQNGLYVRMALLYLLLK